MWVKFTERWREGGIGTYIWVEFSNPTKQSIQEYANELVYRNHYDDNEGWRGYAIEIHEFPPKEYVKRLINNCRDSINYNKKRISELKEVLKQIKSNDDASRTKTRKVHNKQSTESNSMDSKN